MADTDFTDEMLMRYADGELDEATANALERAMETDDALAERVGLFLKTRAMARDALKPLAGEPVPEALAASVERMIAANRERRGMQAASGPASLRAEPATAGRVVQFPAQPKRFSVAGWRLPVAASIAAILGGLCGYWLSGGGEPAVRGLQVAGIDDPALAEALATAPSGAEVRLDGTGERLRPVATFRDASNDVCREFEVDSADRTTVISVACRRDDAWQVTFAVVVPGDDGGYAPASSAEALDAYLAAIEALPPMPAEEEAKALAEARR